MPLIITFKFIKFIAKVLIKKYKRDVEIIFSGIKNIKKIKTKYLLKAYFHLLKLRKK